MALFIDGKISGVRRFQANPREISLILLVVYSQLKRVNEVAIFFLKHVSIDTVYGLSGGVVLFIVGNFIDEEQRKNLDAARKERSFPLEMGKNRLANLNPPQLLFADFAEDIARDDPLSVGERDGVVTPIDPRDDKAGSVLFQLIGLIIHIEPFSNRHRFLANARCTFVIKLQRRSRRFVLREIDALQVKIPLRRRAAGDGDSLDRDLLDQLFIVCFHRVEAIDHIIIAVFLVRCRIAHGKQRVKFLEAELRLFALDGLRLVDDENRVRLRENVDRPAAAELVQLHINTPRVLAGCVKRLRVDDHDVDRAVRSEAVDFGKLRGVIDEEADFLTVILRKVILRDLKGFIHALADGDARYNHDEFAPAETLVQLEHGFDVGIGFANACFHLDGEVVFAFEVWGRRELIGALNAVDVFQNDGVGQLRHKGLVAKAGVVQFLCIGYALPLPIAAFVHHIGRREEGLACEHVADSLCRICLKFLVFKLEFHVLVS